MARLPRAGRAASNLPDNSQALADQLADLEISSNTDAASDNGVEITSTVDSTATGIETPASVSSSSTITGNSTNAQRRLRDVNIIRYFNTAYGREEKLAGWKKFCEDVGVEPGESIKGCKRALKSVYINIVDFVAFQEGGAPYKRFGSYTALKWSIRHSHKTFPLKKAKESPILRFMLIKVF